MVVPRISPGDHIPFRECLASRCVVSAQPLAGTMRRSWQLLHLYLIRTLVTCTTTPSITAPTTPPTPPPTAVASGFLPAGLRPRRLVYMVSCFSLDAAATAAAASGIDVIAPGRARGVSVAMRMVGF
ncbi:unnamed protein product [Laminaria digitata]